MVQCVVATPAQGGGRQSERMGFLEIQPGGLRIAL